MPWIVRLRHEKEIVFAEPQQDIMLGRILAEARVEPVRARRHSVQFDEIDVQPQALPDLADPSAELGAAADRLIAELEFDYDGAVIPAGRTTPAGRLDRARPGHPPRLRRPRARPTSCCSSWGSASRKTRGSTPARWSFPPSEWRR